ncbi:hypothetical protein B0H13DRAFT_1924265 [Mycena leptocephala]|nr:hypothetical protein B0H13DRAFT_1924265 [Mycena leptocephala]
MSSEDTSEPNPQVVSELSPWQSKRFRDYELPWVKAAESLLGDRPLIEIRPNKDGSRWTVFNKATDKIAIFSHASVWCWASPPQTGNFVPEGEVAPDGVHSSRILPELSKKIETSYAFNTQDDPGFYMSARILEDHATSIKGFNKYKKRRRSWQQGETDYARRRFIFSARLVIRKNPHNAKDGPAPVPPYQLHPWIKDALDAQRFQIWMPNPEMPSILDYDEGKLQMLKPTTSQYFKNGDIVWFSFALSFDINANNWMPEYKPLDFVRVGSLPVSSESRMEYSAADFVGSAYQSLSTGSASVLDDLDRSLSYNEIKDLKRSRDSDGDDTMSDGGLSDICLGPGAETGKAEETSSAKPTSSKGAAAVEDGSKKKPPGKGKGK